LNNQKYIIVPLLSAHQPVYLPGLIIMNKIAQSDIFVLLPHVQFVAHSWQMRNKVRGSNGENFLSVPVKHKGSFGQSIGDVEIASQHWRKKHLKSIFYTYQNRPYFSDYFPTLELILSKDWFNLVDLNKTILSKMLEWFDISTKILDSRDYPAEGKATDMLISLCQTLEADAYLSSPGERSYIDIEAMQNVHINHFWQDFEHPVYDQGGEFIPNLSALDILFNCGPEARSLVNTCGSLTASEGVSPANDPSLPLKIL
jgi:hypothetical protein